MRKRKWGGGGKKQKETTVLQGNILKFINREQLIPTTIYSKELLHGGGCGGEREGKSGDCGVGQKSREPALEFLRHTFGVTRASSFDVHTSKPCGIGDKFVP